MLLAMFCRACGVTCLSSCFVGLQAASSTGQTRAPSTVQTHAPLVQAFERSLQPDLVLDVEEGHQHSASSSSNVKRADSLVLDVEDDETHGSLASLFEWCSVALQDLSSVGLAHGMSWYENLEEALSGLVLTSCFSGVGTAELTACQIVQTITGQSTPVDAYAATELDLSAQGMLLSHHEASKPCHVFGDVLDRMDDEDKEALKSMEGNYLAQLTELKQALAGSMDMLPSIDKREFERKRAELGTKYWETLVARARKVKFRKEAPCARHGHFCPWVPEMSGQRR
eukprot:5447830-Amphidinium_carterae.1